MAKWEGGGEEAARRRRMKNKKLRTGIRAGAAVSLKRGRRTKWLLCPQIGKAGRMSTNELGSGE